jgi:hypothetical protein
MSNKTSQSKVKHSYQSALSIFVKGASKAEGIVHRNSGLHFRRISGEARLAGIPATPHHDLVFRGGRTLPHLTYVNFYVADKTDAGAPAWDANDIHNIDSSLALAMSDKGLNNVLAQYFGGQAPTAIFAKRRILQGTAPKVISRGDIDHLIQSANISGFDLDTTIFNFLLPRGTVLTDDAAPSGGELKKVGDATKGKARKAEPAAQHPIVDKDEDEKASSLEGLGGYHGSVHLGGKKVYFAVGVFSEKRPDGTENGIVAFDEPWKNVVATFYHELCEARTDADVEEANNTGNEALIGWTSPQGEEIGDFPVFEDPSLSLVFAEVTLTGSTQKVPIQLMYSNAVHGPEGPVPQPHKAAKNSLQVSAGATPLARRAISRAFIAHGGKHGGSVAQRVFAVLNDLGPTVPVLSDRTIGDLGLVSDEVRAAMNDEFFPGQTTGLSEEQVTDDITVRALTIEINTLLGN